MLKVANRLARLLVRGEQGASFTEYGLLLAVVVLAVGVSAVTLSTDIQTLLTNVGNAIAGVTVPTP